MSRENFHTLSSLSVTSCVCTCLLLPSSWCDQGRTRLQRQRAAGISGSYLGPADQAGNSSQVSSRERVWPFTALSPVEGDCGPTGPCLGELRVRNLSKDMELPNEKLERSPGRELKLEWIQDNI